MDSKDTKDAKEAKDIKETKEIKDTKDTSEPKKSYWYFILAVVIVLVLVLIVIIVIINSVKQDQISELQKQIDKLKSDNQNLDSQITGYSSKIDSIKSLSENVKDGNVLFWSEDGNSVITGRVPLNSYSARILSELVINESGADITNIVFKNVNKNGSSWTAFFVCKDAMNDTTCGGQVMIDGSKKTYSYTPNA